MRSPSNQFSTNFSLVKEADGTRLQLLLLYQTVSRVSQQVLCGELEGREEMWIIKIQHGCFAVNLKEKGWNNVKNEKNIEIGKQWVQSILQNYGEQWSSSLDLCPLVTSLNVIESRSTFPVSLTRGCETCFNRINRFLTFSDLSWLRALSFTKEILDGSSESKVNMKVSMERDIIIFENLL
jgi:hypothetical protein